MFFKHVQTNWRAKPCCTPSLNHRHVWTSSNRSNHLEHPKWPEPCGHSLLPPRLPGWWICLDLNLVKTAHKLWIDTLWTKMYSTVITTPSFCFFVQFNYRLQPNQRNTLCPFVDPVVRRATKRVENNPWQLRIWLEALRFHASETSPGERKSHWTSRAFEQQLWSKPFQTNDVREKHDTKIK